MTSTNPPPIRPVAPSGAPRVAPWALRAGILLVLVAGAYVAKSCGLLDSAPEPSPSPPSRTTPAAPVPLETRIPDVTIRDLEGKVVQRGEVDLSKTLERIERNERLSFRNDGAAFANRENRLPRKPSGYYREWVHPTSSLPGPGPQRVVTGDGGEIFYTADHYKSFRRLR